MKTRERWIGVAAVMTTAVVGAWVPCSAQDAPPATQPVTAASGAMETFPFIGHIVGTNVMIRSGPDTNYYPVTKLNTGAEVTVYARQFGWLAIAPPPGCYSLIDRTFVDRSPSADDMGIVNGDNVWVRVGSDMSSQKYAQQVQLRKGAEVKILGETADGAYYRIVPPEGARLWVSERYVKGGRGMAVTPPKPASPGSRKPTTRPGTIVQASPRVRVEVSTTQPAAHFGSYAGELTEIDALIAREMEKPLAQQNLAPFIRRLRPVADQDEEEVAKRYAEERIRQLQRQIETITALQEIATMRKKADEEHALAAKVRDSIKPPPDVIVDGRVEARGELRPSTIFTGASKAFPKRFRLVDPATDNTVAYVEATPRSSVEVLEEHLGRCVVVRARERKLTAGTVQPVPVLPVDEIQVLPPTSFNPGLIELPNREGAPTRSAGAAASTTRPAVE